MSNKVSVLILILALVVVFHNWLLPGVRVAHDFPYVYPGTYSEFFDLPLTWTDKTAEGLGESAIFTMWSWPINLGPALLTILGVSFSIVERLVVLVVLILGGWGVWKLLSSYKINSGSKLVGTFIYLANSYIILLIDGGQISIALAYSFLPIVFLNFENALQGKITSLLLFGISSSVLAFFDIRYLAILIVLLIVKFLYGLLGDQDASAYLRSYAKPALVALLTFIGLHSFWIIPFFYYPLPQETFTYLTQTSFISLINLGQALTLLSPHWYKNIYGVTSPLLLEFLVFPALAFSAAFFVKRSKGVGFWLVIAVVSIFLIKGFSEPLSAVNTWLFQLVPGFSLFRDTTKFFVLLALSYAVLISMVTQEITKKIKLGNLIVLALILFTLKPVLLNQMTGTFNRPIFEEEYQQVHGVLERDTNFSRVLWVPTHPPLGFSDPTHPIIEATRLIPRRPFSVGVKGEYETLNYLREATSSGELLDVAGIGYLAYSPMDPRRDDFKQDKVSYHQLFLNQLSKEDYVETKVVDSPVTLFKLHSHQNRAFLTDQTWLVLGSDDLNVKLSDNALIYLDEHPTLFNQLIYIPNSRIVLNNKTLLDLAASFIPANQLYFPSSMLNKDPDQSNWWKRNGSDVISWRSFLQEKYGLTNQDFSLKGGWSVSEGSNKLTTQLQGVKDQILLARVMESSQSGKIRFTQDGLEIGEIKTKEDTTNVRWFEVGALQNQSGINIETEGAINVVNALVIIDSKLWEEFKKKSSQLSERISNFRESPTSDNSNIEINRINSAKYQVRVSNMGDNPRMLIFSESYDPKWKLNGQGSVPVYSLLNGYLVEKDGEYTLDYEPQRLVVPSLMISGVFFLIILFLLYRFRNS